MRPNRANILLLGIEGTQTLPIAEMLHKAGHRVVGSYHERYGYGSNSRYVDRKIRVADFTDVAGLIGIIKAEEIDVIIPMGDFTAEFLSKNKDELSKYAKFTMPSHEIFMNAYDKNKLMRLCAEKGYPHPQTLDLSLPHEDGDIESFPYPALIKPNITTGGRGMTLVESAEEFRQKYGGIKEKYGDCHLQQFIPNGGRQVKVQIFVDRKNDMHYGSVILKQRYYPETGGSSCCNVTIKDDALVEMCLSDLNDLRWEGFADFDLIEDQRDGILKIMEINPRVPACLKSAVKSGIDYGNIMANYVLDKENPEYEYRPGAKLRHIGFEVLWFLSSKNRFKTKPNWFAWISRRLYCQDFSWAYPMPFIAGTYGNIKKIFNSDCLKQKQGVKRK